MTIGAGLSLLLLVYEMTSVTGLWFVDQNMDAAAMAQSRLEMARRVRGAYRAARQGLIGEPLDPRPLVRSYSYNGIGNRVLSY